MTNDRYLAIFKVVNLIPHGKVASYGQIADLAGLPGRARLAGKALGYVPDGMQVNWHRVLRSNGQIAFAKGSEHAKLQIGKLQSENVAVLNHRVKLKEFQWQPDILTLLQELDF
jgi:methylated-DNA-protein-cysteine methyltransferase-like protein